MFEKEIKFIGDFCFNQVRSLGSSFNLDKIISAGVHPAVVQYISAELDYMIYSDRRKLLQQSYFDYAGKEISDHFQKISSEIKKHKKISLDDSKKLIFQAVSFNINYLVRPRWSLIKLIFNDQPLISVEEMRMLLNYLYYYEYFKKVLNGYILKRNLTQISSTEFDILLNKIDNELINSNQHQVISNSFTSMGDFFNVGGVDKNRLPLSAVEIFCTEKNLVDLVLRLRKAVPNEVKRRFDKVEIERILFSQDVIKKSGTESELEDESKTEQMIEALDAEQTTEEVEDIETESEVESENPDKESFLSPEEEEELLSLYSEETQELTETNEETSNTEDEDEDTNVKVDYSQAEGVRTPLDLMQPSELESEDVEEETNFSEDDTFEKAEVVVPEISDEDSSESEISSEVEIEGIVDAISDDLHQEDMEFEDDSITESVRPFESEVEDQPEEFETEISDTEVENEIVKEMIEDFSGQNDSEISEEEDEEPKVEGTFTSESSANESEVTEKIASLEDDLLNIFEGLEDEEFKFPDKERFSVDTPEPFEEEIKEDVEAEPQPSEVTDGFDEYLKSIDELIFTDIPAKTNAAEKMNETRVESKVEEQVQEQQTDEQFGFEEKIEVPLPKVEKIKDVPVPSNNKGERGQNKTRTLRQKDLFSYLKRKEIKKIVSYIFANDEEDFTNTVERVMDCNSYKEASEILKAVFTSYKISPYSKEAITFTNAVSNYFRQA